jgi:hypothetical protein
MELVTTDLNCKYSYADIYDAIGDYNRELDFDDRMDRPDDPANISAHAKVKDNLREYVITVLAHMPGWVELGTDYVCPSAYIRWIVREKYNR